MQWEDCTTFSRREKDRTPRIWHVVIQRLVITVHRHRDYKENEWLLSCAPFFDLYLLENKDIALAKQEAILLVKNVLQEEVLSFAKAL